MNAITVNLRKFHSSEKIKTSLFVSAQPHNLSSCARLWRLNGKKKKQITALVKYVPQNPPLVSKGLSEGYFENERLVYK